MLLDAGLPAPTPQYELAVGPDRYRIDLAYPHALIAIEYDGYAAHTGVSSFESDRRRQNALVQAGWTVLRFTARDLREGAAEVVSLVRSALAQNRDHDGATSAPSWSRRL